MTHDNYGWRTDRRSCREGHSGQKRATRNSVDVVDVVDERLRMGDMMAANVVDADASALVI